MRYVILPLAAILYIIWCYESIKELINYGLMLSKDRTQAWVVIHCIALIATIIHLSIVYW